MLRHKSVNTNSHLNMNMALTKFVRGILARDYGRYHTGIVRLVTYNGGSLSDIVIQVLGVEGEPNISWSDGHFIIKENDVFVVNDPVILLPARGRFFVLKIEDDFTVRNNNGTGSFSAGGAADIITHNLGITPSVEDIHVMFTNTATNDIGHIWVDTITSTQFTVRIKNVPGSTLNYSWKVDSK